MQIKDVIVLGCTSWIGFKLTKELHALGYIVRGTSRNTVKGMPWLTSHHQIVDTDDIVELLNKFQPDCIINLLRGEDNENWDIFCSSLITDSYYIYMSSSLALDGYPPGTLLTDNLTPNSISKYGTFKAKCEEKLKGHTQTHLVVRFNSIHGLVPHKITRTQSFIEKLVNNDCIVVDTEVVQSRLLDDVLIEYLIYHLRNMTLGTLHLASNQKSEEIDFLSTLASHLGFSKKSIVPGTARNLYNALEPSKHMFPDGEYITLTDVNLIERFLVSQGIQNLLTKRHTNGNKD